MKYIQSKQEENNGDSYSETNEIQTERKINKTKSWLFEKIKNSVNLQLKQHKISKLRMETGITQILKILKFKRSTMKNFMPI